MAYRGYHNAYTGRQKSLRLVNVGNVTLRLYRFRLNYYERP